MKKLKITITAIAIIAFLSSCGVNMSHVYNHNTNSTQVQLSHKNYKVINRVSGSEDVSYVLIFGGAKKKEAYANAYANMLDKANLENGSRALVNVLTEEHVGGVPPFFYKRTITVSAHVIEFTE